jgi:hypothetical protein
MEAAATQICERDNHSLTLERGLLVLVALHYGLSMTHSNGYN